MFDQIKEVLGDSSLKDGQYFLECQRQVLKFKSDMYLSMLNYFKEEGERRFTVDEIQEVRDILMEAGRVHAPR